MKNFGRPFETHWQLLHRYFAKEVYKTALGDTIWDLPTAFTVSSTPRVNRAVGVTLKLGFTQKNVMMMISQWDWQCCFNILINWWNFVSTTHCFDLLKAYATPPPPHAYCKFCPPPPECKRICDHQTAWRMLDSCRWKCFQNRESRIKPKVLCSGEMFTCSSRWRRSGGAGQPGQSRRGRRPSAWDVALRKSQPESCLMSAWDVALRKS